MVQIRKKEVVRGRERESDREDETVEQKTKYICVDFVDKDKKKNETD